MSGFLNKREVIRLTGEREKSAQIAWLKREMPGQYRINACGEPVISWSVIDQPGQRISGTWSPDFSRIG